MKDINGVWVTGKQRKFPSYHTKTGIARSRSLKTADTTHSSGRFSVCIVRRLGGIGDVLMTTPMTRAIKYKWPNCRLTYATDFNYMGGSLKHVLASNPYLDAVISYDMVNSSAYDFIFDVSTVCVSNEQPGAKTKNRIDLFADFVGVDLNATGRRPVFCLDTSEIEWGKQKLSALGYTPSKKLVVVQPRASAKSRSWDLDNVRKLVIDLSKDSSLFVLVVDSSKVGVADQEQWNFPNVKKITNFGIRHVASILNHADLLIGPDSGLLHVAGALNVPTVTIFAGTYDQARVNHYPNSFSLAANKMACYPCWYKPEPCKNQFFCIRSITPDQVKQKAYDVLAKNLKRLPSEHSYMENIHAQIENSSVLELRRTIGGLGDIVCMTSLARSIKEEGHKGKLRINVPKQYRCVFQNNPFFEIIDENTKYVPSKVIDVTNTDSFVESSQLAKGKISSTRPEIYTESCGFSTKNKDNLKPYIVLTDEEIAWAKKLLSKRGPGTKTKHIGIVMHSAESYRNWPEVNSFDLLLKVGQQRGMKAVMIDDKRWDGGFDRGVIDATGYSIRRMFSVVSQCDVIVTPDTGVLHVAAAFDIPTVFISGPVDGKLRARDYKNTETIMSDKRPCLPCWRNGMISCKVSKTDKSACLEDITVNMVFDKILYMLKKGNED